MALVPTIWNAVDKGTWIDLTSDALNVTYTGSGNNRIRSLYGTRRRRWYWEHRLLAISQDCNLSVGVWPGNQAISNGISGSVGTVNVPKSQLNPADIIGVAFDADAGTVTVYLNGEQVGTSTGLDMSQLWYAVVGDDYNSGHVTLSTNFGQYTFIYPVPYGFQAGFGVNRVVDTVDYGTNTLFWLRGLAAEVSNGTGVENSTFQRNITRLGSVGLSSYNNGSYNFDSSGAGGSIQSNIANAFNVLSGDFILELKARRIKGTSKENGTGVAVALTSSSTGSVGPYLEIGPQRGIAWVFNSAVRMNYSTISPYTDVMRDICISRVAGVTRLFIDGEIVTQFTDNNNYRSSGFSVGDYLTGSNTTDPFNGFLDEIRLIKGVGRAAAYDPPLAYSELPSTYNPNPVGEGASQYSSMTDRLSATFRIIGADINVLKKAVATGGNGSSSGGTGAQITVQSAVSGHKLVSIIGGNMVYADSTNLAHIGKISGLTTNAADAGGTVVISDYGPITESSWTFTPDLPLYVGTNGVMTQTPPETGFSQIVGYAITSTTIFLNFQPPIILG